MIVNEYESCFERGGYPALDCFNWCERCGALSEKGAGVCLGCGYEIGDECQSGSLVLYGDKPVKQSVENKEQNG
jgi:hypothetical protein